MTRKKKRAAHRDRPAVATPRPATPPDRVMLALAVLGLGRSIPAGGGVIRPEVLVQVRA